MEATFIQSQRNGKCLYFEGYLYRVNKRTNEKSYWKCTTSNCTASVNLDCNDKMIISATGIHCHATDPADIEVKRFYQDLKRSILEEPYTPAPEIYWKTLSKIQGSTKFLSQIPTFNSIKHFMYNVRHSVIPRIPRKVADGSRIKRTFVNLGEKPVLEENNCLLPNQSPREVECVVDYRPSHLLEENHCQDVQASNTNLALQIQKRTQYSRGKQKLTSSDNSPEHIECSVDLSPSQFSVHGEENQCRDGQVTETHHKQSPPDEKFIKKENSQELSVVYPPNHLVEQNGGENRCQVVQVIDEDMNGSKKRKLNSREEPIVEPSSISLPDTTRKDEFHVFGDYVASELRKLSPRALALAKHNINNILFEANIGNYDSPSASGS